MLSRQNAPNQRERVTDARRFPRVATFRRGRMALVKSDGPSVMPDDASVPVIVTEISMQGIAAMSAQASDLELWGESPLTLEIGELVVPGKLVWFKKDGRGAWIAGIKLDVASLERPGRAELANWILEAAREFGPT